MSIQLTIISLDFDSDEKPRTEVYEREIINIGKLATNDVVLSGEDVADYHAQIRIDNNGSGLKLYLTDLGTGLGTRLENLVIQPHTEVPFEFNKRISIGSYLIKPMEAKAGETSTDTDSSVKKSFYTPRSTPSRVIIREETLKPSALVANKLPSAINPVVQAEIEEIKVTPKKDIAAPKSFSYAKQEHKVNISLRGQDIAGLDFEAAELFAVSGTLLNKGKGIVNYKIDLGEAGTTTTNDKGEFTLNDILDGTSYNLKLNDPQYKFNLGTTEGVINKDLSIAITATKIFSISGKVLHKNQPMQGVTLNAGPLGTATSSADGHFEFKNIEEDKKYEIAASKAKYLFDKPSINGVLTSSVNNLVFNANQLLSVSGRVMHKGQPMEGVEIDAGPLGKTISDSEGYYCFTDVPDGTEYAITARKGKFVFGTKNGTTGA